MGRRRPTTHDATARGDRVLGDGAGGVPDFNRPLTPSAVGQVEFSAATRGYRREEVEAFRNRVRHQLQRHDSEKADLRNQLARLREEVQRMHDFYRRQNSDLDIPGEIVIGTVVASDEAVALLSQAQQAADAQLADAEQQARQIIEMARQRYQEVLTYAQTEASRAVNESAQRADQATGSPEAQVWRDLAVFVQAFTLAMENDVRAVLDRGREELDRRVADMRASSALGGPSAPPALGAQRSPGAPERLNGSGQAANRRG
jgi:DivIVA domain-containing protein